MNSSNHYKADDSSTVFDADTVAPDEVPSLPAMPPLTASATFTDYLYNNINESTSSTSIQEESPANTISELLRRINSLHPAMLSTNTTTATVTARRSEEISTNESSSLSSKKRTITNSSSDSSRKKTRRSSHLKRQSQKPDKSCEVTSDSEVEDENGHDDDKPDEAVTNQSSSSQTSTTTLNKFDARWKSKFQELRAYKQLHGHTSVPNKWRDNRQLGKWVSTQRTQYKKFKKNEKSSMTPERVDLLNSIGFEWVYQNDESKVAPKRGGSSKNESAWNKRFTELVDYKKESGDTNVPHRWEDNKQLGLWVHKQRAEYKKFKANKKAHITKERIEKLESIGFEWVSPNQGTPKNESVWNKRFNELVDYKEESGNTNVPIRWEDNKQLGLWVSTQRSQYKKFKKNEKSCMTLERINMLNSIGFQWECRPARAPRS